LYYRGGAATTVVLLVSLALAIVTPTVSSQSNVFYNKTFTLQGFNVNEGRCHLSDFYVYNAAGGIVVGSVSVSAGRIDFYILSQAEYDQFVKNTGHASGSNPCPGMRPKSSELSEEGITSNYSFVYSVPDNANHHFVYFNPYLVDATVTATLARRGQSTTSASSQIYSTTSASSQTYPSQTYPYSSQTKPPQTYATQTASPSTTVPVSQIMTAVVAIAVVALVALFLYSRRGKQPKSTQPKYIQPAATIREMKPESGKTFCIECGKELPPQAKFCRDCGTKQP